MKIVTWNINSLRLRIAALNKLTDEHKPDIIALQETKVTDDLFPLQALQSMGYSHAVFTGEKSYNGMAILSKIPLSGVFSIELYNSDKRHIAAKIGDIELHNFYVPAGGDIADPAVNDKFNHKLQYLDLIKSWFQENRSAENKIILCGDLNVAPHSNDVWSSTQLRNVVSHTDVERSKLLSLQQSFHFIDSARHFTPMEEKLYTWWSYRNRDWKKSNRGRRLDHIWVSGPLKAQLKSVLVLKEARDWHLPSDHVPYIVDLK